MNDAELPTRTEAQTDNYGRECDRCGRDRPRDPERLAITASDYADSTIAFDKYLLCWRCWDHIKGELGRCLA